MNIIRSSCTAPIACRSPRLTRQGRTKASFKIDPRFKRGNGYLRYAFKTKHQIDKEEREKMAAEWNEWDLETIVRYKSQKEWNAVAKPESVKAKAELKMKLRKYATQGYRGNMPRPREMALLLEVQNMPGEVRYEDYIRDGDLNSLDMRLLLTYVDFDTIPPPEQLLHALLDNNHVFDDYSSGYFFNYCALHLKRLVDNKTDGIRELSERITRLFKSMKLLEGGHRCTFGSFSYSQLIKCAALTKDLPAALALKEELVEYDATLLNASVYEGIFQACVEANKPHLGELEFTEMTEKFGLAPTEECFVQLLRGCALTRNLARGEEIWKLASDTLTTNITDIRLFNAKMHLAVTCGEKQKAFYHYHEFLEYTDLKPTVETCNTLLLACESAQQIEDVLFVLKEKVTECNDATFKNLFFIAASLANEAAGTTEFRPIEVLDRAWDLMQSQRVRPDTPLLNLYLTALLSLPRSDVEYHPAEVLGRGIAAFEFSVQNTLYDSASLLAMLRLCAKAGQLHVAKGVLKKLLFSGLEYTSEHAGALIACVGSSAVVRPLTEAEHFIKLLPVTDAQVYVPFYCLLTSRGNVFEGEEEEGTQEAMARLEDLWNTIEGKLDRGNAEMYAEDVAELNRFKAESTQAVLASQPQMKLIEN